MPAAVYDAMVGPADRPRLARGGDGEIAHGERLDGDIAACRADQGAGGEADDRGSPRDRSHRGGGDRVRDDRRGLSAEVLDDAQAAKIGKRIAATAAAARADAGIRRVVARHLVGPAVLARHSTAPARAGTAAALSQSRGRAALAMAAAMVGRGAERVGRRGMRAFPSDASVRIGRDPARAAVAAGRRVSREAIGPAIEIEPAAAADVDAAHRRAARAAALVECVSDTHCYRRRPSRHCRRWSSSRASARHIRWRRHRRSLPASGSSPPGSRPDRRRRRPKSSDDRAWRRRSG